MGNIIVSNDFIDVVDAKIRAQSTASGFSKADVMDLESPFLRWRMNSANKSNINPILVFDMTAAKTLSDIVLDHVNFDKVIILGHASDLNTDWTTATFTSGILSISCDAQTGRYKIHNAPVDFNYEFVAFAVPTTASAVGNYTTKWEVGRIALLDSSTEWAKNMNYGYVRGARRPYKENKLDSGRRERAELGPIAWEGTLSVGGRTIAQEADLTALNNLNITGKLMFFENDDDSSKVYICYRDDNYFGTMTHFNRVEGTTIKLCEAV